MLCASHARTGELEVHIADDRLHARLCGERLTEDLAILYVSRCRVEGCLRQTESHGPRAKQCHLRCRVAAYC